MESKTRAERRFVDLDPRNKCAAGCGNTARLGERYCGLHMPDGEDPPRVTAVEGCKQVLLDGHHLADAVSPEAAQAIAMALNYVGLRSDQMPEGPRLTLETFLA